MRAFACATLLLVSLLSTAAIAQIDFVAEGERLRNTYPDGSIYLTYTALNNFNYHLANRDKRLGIEQSGINAASLDSLTAFLNDTAREALDPGRATAFLRLDMTTLKAYTKKASDNNGVSTPVAWTPDQVRVIAYVCDRIFSGDRRIAEATTQTQEGKLTLTQAWQQLDRLQRDPYAQTVSLVPLIEANRQKLAATRLDEIYALKEKDPETLQEIFAFARDYDRADDVVFSHAFAPERFGSRMQAKRALSSYFAAKKLPAPIMFEERTIARDFRPNPYKPNS